MEISEHAIQIGRTPVGVVVMGKSASALASSKSRTISAWPYRHARCMDANACVAPPSPALAMAFTSAPAWSSSRTISALPLLQAHMRGVKPDLVSSSGGRLRLCRRNCTSAAAPDVHAWQSSVQNLRSEFSKPRCKAIPVAAQAAMSASSTAKIECRSKKAFMFLQASTSASLTCIYTPRIYPEVGG
jgi:hypothetical protein